MNEKLTKLETEVEKKIRNEKNCQKSGNGRKRKKKILSTIKLQSAWERLNSSDNLIRIIEQGRK